MKNFNQYILRVVVEDGAVCACIVFEKGRRLLYIHMRTNDVPYGGELPRRAEAHSLVRLNGPCAQKVLKNFKI